MVEGTKLRIKGNSSGHLFADGDVVGFIGMDYDGTYEAIGGFGIIQYLHREDFIILEPNNE